MLLSMASALLTWYDAHLFRMQDNKTAYQIAKDKHKTKCVQFLKSWYEASQVRNRRTLTGLATRYCLAFTVPC